MQQVSESSTKSPNDLAQQCLLHLYLYLHPLRNEAEDDEVGSSTLRTT